MKTSRKEQEQIKSHESLRLKAYLCPANAWTIGWGHTKGVSSGMEISEQTAQDFFDSDLAVAENAVIELIGSKLMNYVEQQEFDAMVSFLYNFGKPKTRNYTILKVWKTRFQARKDTAESDELVREWFGKYIHGGGHQLSGLVARREYEADLFLS